MPCREGDLGDPGGCGAIQRQLDAELELSLERRVASPPAVALTISLPRRGGETRRGQAKPFLGRRVAEDLISRAIGVSSHTSGWKATRDDVESAD